MKMKMKKKKKKKRKMQRSGGGSEIRKEKVCDHRDSEMGIELFLCICRYYARAVSLCMYI